MRSIPILLAFLVSVSGVARAEACRLLKVAALPITPDADGRTTVPVSVNGRELKFLVDTGGVFSAISERLVTEHGMRHRSAFPGLDLNG